MMINRLIWMGILGAAGSAWCLGSDVKPGSKTTGGTVQAPADSTKAPVIDPATLRAFDFWVGDWEVFGPKGKKIGENHIKLRQDGHIIEENWSSGGGKSRGVSINYYDPGSKTWRQNWVSNAGGVVRYEGSVRDGAMHFRGESISPAGVVELAIVTLTPVSEGRVHHVIKHSKDNGTTWYPAFNGMYVLRNSSGK